MYVKLEMIREKVVMALQVTFQNVDGCTGEKSGSL
jgi:hypothetical protein